MKLRKKGNGSTLSDIEVCFNALYGVMMLRMAKKARFGRHGNGCKRNFKRNGNARGLLQAKQKGTAEL